MLLALVLSACRHGPPKPVEIEAADVCAQCRMAISEKHYAAELLDAHGTAFKFDDIGCMARFYRARGGALAAFVVDYDRQSWIAAPQAFYVKAPDIRSPMASGLIALRDREAAERHAARPGATILRFADLMEK